MRGQWIAPNMDDKPLRTSYNAFIADCKTLIVTSYDKNRLTPKIKRLERLNNCVNNGDNIDQ